MQSIVRCLDHHLPERIWREPVTHHKHLPISLELQRLTANHSDISDRDFVSANQIPTRSSGVSTRSSLVGDMSTGSWAKSVRWFASLSPLRSPWRISRTGRTGHERVGADGLIDRARSLRLSVKMSDANRRTVWPSTPVYSKLIPAEPSAQTIIWS